MMAAVSPDATAGASSVCVDTESNGSGGALAGDSPARRKRRSWKQHRVEAMDVSYVGVGVGMAGLRRTHDLYACDQCDKMFGKQSSLARHKYEHSGTTYDIRRLWHSHRPTLTSLTLHCTHSWFIQAARSSIKQLPLKPSHFCISVRIYFTL